MVNLEPTASATYISFFQLDMKWSWQESRDVIAELLLWFFFFLNGPLPLLTFTMS